MTANKNYGNYSGVAWLNRQQRLKDILGTNVSLCLQVCVGVTKRISGGEEFDALVEKLGIDFSARDHIHLPKKSLQEEIFPPSWLYQSSDTQMANHISIEALYTISPYALVGSDPDTLNASNDLKEIMRVYVPLIEKRFSDLRFNGRNYVDGDKFSIEFRYLVCPYDPNICHPRELGILKPITLIEGGIISPSKHVGSEFSLQRA